MMFQLRSEFIDSNLGWRYGEIGNDMHQALADYTRAVEAMCKERIKRVQLWRNNQFMSEVTM